MQLLFPGEFAFHGHRVKIYSNDLNSLNTVFKRMEEDKRQLKIDGILLNKSFIVSRHSLLTVFRFFL